MSTKVDLTKVFLYCLLSFLILIFFLPFFWMFTTALKTTVQIFAYPIKWLPNPVAWQNFSEMWGLISFSIPLRNSCIITFGSLIGIFLSAPLVAFGFARLRFWGRDLLFIVVLATIMLPIQVTIIPLYIIYHRLGWIDTFKPLIIPFWFGGTPFFIFLLRQFFMAIPMELEDAAKIDGCSTLGIYWRIFLPLAKPALAAVGIFAFIQRWNAYFGPLIYVSSREKQPITVVLALFKDVQGSLQYNLVMAGAVISIIPCIVIFLLFQKYFVKGITVTGIKE